MDVAAEVAVDAARQPWKPAHRADVQGLRAVAVLLVVACHAGLGLPGGFVGVDVFFVVSGFVISRELLAEREHTGTIRLRDFYARRARRLLPTLAVVVIAVMVASVLLLNPFGPQTVALRTATAATGFVANGYLYRHVGYFDLSADAVNPFLHLWSLSVEEQFYLVLPGALLLLARGGRARGGTSRRLLPWVLGGSAVSFAAAWYLTSGHEPFGIQAPVRLAFYASPTRGWEFGVGVLLALGEPTVRRIPPAVAAVGGVVGLVALLATARVLDPIAPFPGPAAVPPVLGTALLLVAGERAIAWRRGLGSGALRWIGDRSYAWYLWHWPAVVLARQTWPDAGLARPIAALASLGLAAVTFAAFEDRIRRDRTFVGRRAAFLAVGCTLVTLLVLGAASVGIRHGWGLVEPDGWYDYPRGHDQGCLLYNRDLPNHWREPFCTLRAPRGAGAARHRGTILVLGDEHADAMVEGLAGWVWPDGFDIKELTRTGCPMLGRGLVHYPRCTEYQHDALHLVDRLHPVAVVIGNRSPTYVDDVRDDLTIQADGGGRPTSEAAARAAWGRGFERLLDELDRRRVAVVVVGAPPDFGTAFPRARFSLLHQDARPPSLPRSQVERALAPTDRIEREIVARHRRARWIPAVPHLCGRTACRAAPPGKPWFFYGPGSLTRRGGQRFGNALAQALADLLGPS